VLLHCEHMGAKHTNTCTWVHVHNSLGAMGVTPVVLRLTVESYMGATYLIVAL